MVVDEGGDGAVVDDDSDVVDIKRLPLFGSGLRFLGVGSGYGSCVPYKGGHPFRSPSHHVPITVMLVLRFA